MDTMDKREKVFYVGFGALALLLASLPSLYGAMNTPPGDVFTGLTYNQDDGAVYLSWLRQASQGHFFQRNLFNTDPQRGLVINLWALLLGNLARLTGLSLPAVYQLARVGFGACFLWAVAALLKETLTSAWARQIGFALVCVSGGLGWLWGGFDSTRGDNQPIDLWQPEAISFLSLYYSPLFLAALALIAVFAASVIRAERTERLRDVWPAALAGALLANFHSYDVIPLFLTWGVFRVVQTIRAKRVQPRAWVPLLAAGVATVPLLVYQYVALVQDPLFRARDVGTPSPAAWWTLLGLGLPLVFAVVEIARRGFPPSPTGSRVRGEYTDTDARQWLIIWAVVALACAYLPVDFQRKMIMGAHLPLCVLAGVALDRLTRKLSGDFPKIAVGAAVLVTVPSCALFLLRDIDRLNQNVGSTENRPYLTAFEADALTFLRENGHAGDAVLCSPDAVAHRRFPFFPLRLKLATYVPAWSGLPVYVGHGSETAAWGRKWEDSLRFFGRDADNEFRRGLLTRSGTTYILYDNRLAEPLTDAAGSPLMLGQAPYQPVQWSGQQLPRFLRVAYRNPEITIFQVTGR